MFFFNDTATTEIYTLSLHDALPICARHREGHGDVGLRAGDEPARRLDDRGDRVHPGDGLHPAREEVEGNVNRREKRSEEHTSELQSRQYLVCRLLLEKKQHPVTEAP